MRGRAIRRRSVDEDEHVADRRSGRVGATNAAMTTSVGMPAAFIGHGSPMNALERNDYTGAEFLPTARLSWRLAPRHSVWSALSRTVRAPTRLDADAFIPGRPPLA